MAFPVDLLKLARDLAKFQPENQASLRRAVSTAYYALFHLLISEATANWARPELRAILGRYFDHGPMRSASQFLINTPPKGAEPAVTNHLLTIADAFIQTQQRRNDADYNVAKIWTRDEVEVQIGSVDEAFQAWKIIHNEDVAQAYLLSLLGTRDRRSNEPKPPKSMVERKKNRRGSENSPKAR